MKRIKYLAILFIGLVIFTIQQANAQIIVRIKPHAPKVVLIKTKAPLKGFVWREGHWKIHKNKYVWVKGHWVKKRRNHVWVKGYWKHMNRGWVWVPGRWTRKKIYLSQR